MYNARRLRRQRRNPPLKVRDHRVHVARQLGVLQFLLHDMIDAPEVAGPRTHLAGCVVASFAKAFHSDGPKIDRVQCAHGGIYRVPERRPLAIGQRLPAVREDPARDTLHHTAWRASPKLPKEQYAGCRVRARRQPWLEKVDRFLGTLVIYKGRRFSIKT